MSANRLLRIGVMTLVMTLSYSSLTAATGDAEWQKVKDLIEGIKNPKTKPTSREEAIALFKEGLTQFDTAIAAANKAAPQHPGRWDAALFEMMVGGAREIAGVPAPATKTPTLEEVLNAPDALPETKAQASFIDVMQASEEMEATGSDPAVWVAKAEKHLKAFPNEKVNRAVEGKLASVKALADLKSKPLELKFKTVDGKDFDLAALKGKVVLIDFWATWCGPCVAELPNVLKAYKDLHPKGFEIVGISLDSDKAELEAFVKERGMEWVQYFDGKGWQNEISTRYGVSSIPAMWLVNKKGMVVSTDARAGLEEAVTKLLAEE